MKQPASIDDRVASLGKASKISAALSFLGFILVLGALGYAARELTKLEKQRTDLLAQINTYKTQAENFKSEMERARRAVAASRAAINAFHAGRIEDAVALYDEALEADPSNAYLLNLRAYALFRLHKVEDAIQTQQRSLDADPNYAWGYFDLARFLCAANRLEEAKKAANQALTLRPDLQSTVKNDVEFQRVCHGQISEGNPSTSPGTEAKKNATPPTPLRDEVYAEIEKIRNAPHNNLSIPQTAQTAGGGNPSLKVENETEFELHVLLYGPTTQELRIPPNESRPLHLLPGDYEVAARVSGDNVRPFYGKSSFAANKEYTETFQLTKE